MRVSIITGGGTGSAPRFARRLAAGLSQCPLILHGPRRRRSGLDGEAVVKVECEPAGAGRFFFSQRRPGGAGNRIRSWRAATPRGVSQHPDVIVHAPGSRRRGFAQLPRRGAGAAFAVICHRLFMN